VNVQTGAEATNDICGCFCIIIFYAFLCRADKEKPKGNGINSEAALCRSLLCFEFAAMQSLHIKIIMEESTKAILAPGTSTFF
jgi:hypothetical protein